MLMLLFFRGLILLSIQRSLEALALESSSRMISDCPNAPRIRSAQIQLDLSARDTRRRPRASLPAAAAAHRRRRR